MNHDVFLSYSRKDSETMRRVRDDLRAAGLKVWTDESLEPGTEVWELEVEKAIRGAHTLVVLLSPDALASEWVRNEITLADAINRRIFPMLLRGEQGESIPLRLIASQWIDARTDYPRAVAQLTSTIKSHIARTNAAVTKLSMSKMQRTHSANPAEASVSETSESAQLGGVRIPLSVGVGATMIMFIVVAVAVMLASSTPTSPENTAEPAVSPSVDFDSATLAFSTATPTEEPVDIATNLSGQIAFVSNRTSDLYDIYLLNLDRRTSQLLWQNPYTEAYVTWTPDGDWLTFSSWTAPDYKGDLYNLRVDNIRLVNLTESTSEERYGRWSPDGSQLVFEAQRDSEDVDIWTMNADGSEQTNITNADSWDFEPAWSPDGRLIAFTTNREDITQIWLMSPDGSNLINITPESAHHGQAAWSPDGSRIAYARCIAPAACNYEEAAGTDDNWDIWVMDHDGSNNVQLTDSPMSDLAPTWSPDGTQIAFVSYRDGNAEIYVMNADGSGQVNVSNNPAEDYGPAWRP
jgi:Tol biopolymer transport system component